MPLITALLELLFSVLLILSMIITMAVLWTGPRPRGTGRRGPFTSEPSLNGRRARDHGDGDETRILWLERPAH
ncbi:hypothetical protein HNP84_003267 [Thermocatellispora tengchongensis]|uniref:Uncharacterized protein n=1 Tax=Thermocatellispora tengchongensis TaxID=1073253 RepID=A0A840P6R1_9ACTN|nr:hypothetical protein [Thermocatellispora tengchongensis]MBB5133541.1 hypothetical protein [Thermocatellispora tengchongensis]